MPRLQIDFQDGFSGETVEIVLDNQPLARYEDVRTDLRINLALRYEAELPSGEHTVQVRIPQHALAISIRLTLETDLYVGVALRNGAIVYDVRTEPFIYM
ncbi:MAG: hypothetical protein N2651_03640 [Fimbriimonadales bacterium]|nr:hypothetical protein [Fimbriimonadales bacterium]